MPTHEEQLLAVLEKVGKAADSNLLDADDASASTVETTGDPAPVVPPDADIEAEEPGPSGLIGKGVGNIFVHHDSHPVVLDVALLKAYGVDWFSWEPDTLWREIMEDFRTPSISIHVKGKIQAVRTLHINEWFWTKWEVFCWATQALNNNIPDFQVIQKPSIAQLFVSVDTATLIRDDEEFSQELQGFVAAAVLEEGVVYAPGPIAFCNDEVVQLLEANGNSDASGMIPAVKERWGVISRMTKQEWEKADEMVLDESPEDVQVAKLIVARNYMDLRRRQMKSQLGLLQ